MNQKKYFAGILCFALACVFYATSQATSKPNEVIQKIVFQREGGFHVMNQDGSAQKMLPENKLLVSQVLNYSNSTRGNRILSPDGKFILSVYSELPQGDFISAEGLNSATTCYVDTKDVRSHMQRHLLRLVGDDVTYFAISPDSKRIAYITCDTDNWGYSTNLQIMDVDGKNNKSLAATTKDSYDFWDTDLIFSTDGKTLLFERNFNDNNLSFRIYSINTNGSGLTHLKNQRHVRPDRDRNGNKIIWSYSGATGVSGDENASSEICIVNLDGSGNQDLTHNKANDFNPVFSPDGKQIAFVSDRDGNNEIYVMNADGSGQKRLTKNKLDDNFPQWRVEEHIQ